MLHLNYYTSCNTTLWGTWVNIIGPSMTIVKNLGRWRLWCEERILHKYDRKKLRKLKLDWLKTQPNNYLKVLNEKIKVIEWKILIFNYKESRIKSIKKTPLK
jgi:hypothetical protein